MQAQPKTVSATEIKNRFGDCLAEVISSRDPLIVERHGKPLAVLIDYQNWIKNSDRIKTGSEKGKTPWTDACRKLAQSIRKRTLKPRRATQPVSCVEIIRQVREEEY